MLACYIEEWRHICVIKHLNVSALTLACSDRDITVVLYATCEMGDFMPKIEALFTLTIEDGCTTSAAVLIELFAGIQYLGDCILTMLMDLILFWYQRANFVNVLQKGGASILVHKSNHCDSSILSADGDCVRALNGDLSDTTAFELL